MTTMMIRARIPLHVLPLPFGANRIASDDSDIQEYVPKKRMYHILLCISKQ